jgi:hypothetical protein
LDGLYDRIGELATSPELGPVWRRHANLRRLLYETFYVYYQVDESRRKVIIRAVSVTTFCDLRQDEHLVRLVAPEIRRVIEVRIVEPGVHAIAVVERAFGDGP